MMNERMLLDRASELQKQAERLKSDLDATLGALQDCGYWLNILRKRDGEHRTDTPDTRSESSNL